VFARAQRARKRRRRALQELAERALAVEERHAAQIAAVQVEQIESVKDELGVPLRAQRVLQTLKVRDPLVVERNELTVEQGRRDG
jgi:hypothetical protein